MKTQKWVSVKFDKPKFDEENPTIRSIRCLVFDGKSVGVACFARDAFSNSQPGRWEDEFGGKCRTEITHWMTLPDLPAIEKTTTCNAAVAAINFACETQEGIEFLKLWQVGDVEAILREWPDCPKAAFESLISNSTTTEEA